MEKIEIVSTNIIGYYSYVPDIDVVNYKDSSVVQEDCIICKRSLLDTSYEMISDNKNLVKENNLKIGKCGHVFHTDCIDSWLNNCNTCPIDNVQWHLCKIADTTTKLVLLKNTKNK